MSALQPIPLTGSAHCADAPIVLLGGWGMGRAALAELGTALGASEILELPPLPTNPEESRPFVHEWLAACLPPRVVLIGWSLGGAIAIDFAAAHPARVAALITMATNPCFCARADWSAGMDPATFAAFRAGLLHDHVQQLRRFAALQAQGDATVRVVLRRLRSALAVAIEPAGLLGGLELLAALDVRAQLARLAMPTLHVLGASDRLVPGTIDAQYRRLQPASTVWSVAGAAHAPFLSRGNAVAARVRDFLDARRTPAPRRRDKAEVARSFARAAGGYDAAAHVQRLSGNALLRLAPSGLDPGRALDLGCGTGAQLPALRARFPAAHWHAADIAEGMLQATRARHRDVSTCGADAEALPFTDASFDLVYSNLALQWCDQSRKSLAELRRVLRPNGVALLATLGPDTLWELRAAWRAIDDESHVNRFEDPARIVAAAGAVGLRVERDERLWHVERHRSVLQVAAGLRRLGAHNLDPMRRRGLTGKSAWRQLASAYAELGDGGADAPATWQIIHLVLRKADE